MEATALAEVLLFAALAWIILGSRKVRDLQRELRTRLPVFSAETIRGKEAEFIRERLRRRLPRLVLVMLGAFGVMVVVAWWLTR